MREGSPMMGEASVVMREGSPVMREGSAVMREGSPVMREGSPVMGEGPAVMGEGSAVMPEGSPVMGEGPPVMPEASAVMPGGIALLRGGAAVMQLVAAPRAEPVVLAPAENHPWQGSRRVGSSRSPGSHRLRRFPPGATRLPPSGLVNRIRQSAPPLGRGMARPLLNNVETPRVGGNPRWGRLRGGDNTCTLEDCPRAQGRLDLTWCRRDDPFRFEPLSTLRRRLHRGVPPTRGVSTLGR